MTFGEIYSRIVFLVWGNSNIPSGTQAILVGDEGLIANTHRRLQQEYNYWFNHHYATATTVADTNSYTLPTDYKEIISVVFKETGKDYFREPCVPLPLGASISEEWDNLNSTAEYPTKYEITDEEITFYPTPSAVRTYHLIYYSFLPRPSAFTDDTCIETDDLCKYGADAICYSVAAEMLNILDEFTKARMYKMEAGEAIEMLKEEDRKRRQRNIKRVRYYPI